MCSLFIQMRGRGIYMIRGLSSTNPSPPPPPSKFIFKDGVNKDVKVMDKPETVFHHYERNFITASRATKDFLLAPDDLNGLRRTIRRSPNEHDPPLSVYWRKDVSAKSIQKWGSIENLEKALESRNLAEEEESVSKNRLMGPISKLIKKRRADKKSISRENWPVRNLCAEGGLYGSSGRVVLIAVGINTSNFLLKLGAWIATGSYALFSEAIHSLADTCNQIILAYGIHKSIEMPTVGHPYGYSNMQYVSSLISGTGIFCLGSGLSIYHGISGIFASSELTSLPIAVAVLSCSFVSEGFTLVLAIKSIKNSASKVDMGFLEYVMGGYEPSVNVVLLEDVVAVMGVAIAAGAMSLSVKTGSHIPDAVGSITIGVLLGCVASFMIHSNINALVGRSISDHRLEQINKKLEGDIMIRQVHDVKGIDMGNGFVRYKAELDIDGRELTRIYLNKMNLPRLLAEVETMKTPEEFESFMLKHGENIVDCLGEQVDRIEKSIRTKHPEVRHMDLEVL
ncbi:proton-coupled zinc antiporter SLC30A9, mitochondrial [Lepeophtheirus salmonis]|uniref:proton-coupled zinc antiporter SLC30A9, mitochondrial n=1 Tax=Lepeophtheirus salmonis TaxID=72036 RepID=UPI001AE937B4|nr:zinc transporter 9-like [Lepeophtheirus salmonis]